MILKRWRPKQATPISTAMSRSGSPLFQSTESVSAFCVSKRFNKLTVSHTHHVQPAQRLALISTPPKSPTRDDAITCHDYFLVLETKIRPRSNPLPKLQASHLAYMS